jgi:hypothetical protein
MTSRKNTMAFAEQQDDIDEAVEVLEQTPKAVAPVTASNSDDNFVVARVKGTWKMYWGRTTFEFVDGKRYKLPRDLYDYLVRHSNIYDTV